jgi:hypothetical protein
MSNREGKNDLSSDDLSIEDLFNTGWMLFACGTGGEVIFEGDIYFKVPPATSPNVGRLLLAYVVTGSIRAEVNYDSHDVTLSAVPE